MGIIVCIFCLKNLVIGLAQLLQCLLLPVTIYCRITRQVVDDGLDLLLVALLGRNYCFLDGIVVCIVLGSRGLSRFDVCIDGYDLSFLVRDALQNICFHLVIKDALISLCCRDVVANLCQADGLQLRQSRRTSKSIALSLRLCILQRSLEIFISLIYLLCVGSYCLIFAGIGLDGDDRFC